MGMVCSKCGENAVRMARSGMDRLRYTAIHHCPHCEVDFGTPARWMHLVSLDRCCPKCGGTQLENLKRRDGIDPMYKNPLSLLQGLLGAKLWWCPLCRIQFYDIRRGKDQII